MKLNYIKSTKKARNRILYIFHIESSQKLGNRASYDDCFCIKVQFLNKCRLIISVNNTFPSPWSTPAEILRPSPLTISISS